LLAAAAGNSGCFGDIFGSSADGTATAEETFEYGIERASEIRLRLFGKSGNITVSANGANDSITIHGVLRVTAARADEAEAGLSELWVDVDQSTNEIVVFTAQPSTLDPRSFVVDYEINIPTFMMVSILNVSGDITVSDIRGDVWIQAGSGTVRLNNTFGSASVVTQNGSVDASVVVPLGGELVIGTGNGSIDVAIPKGTSAELFATAANGTISVTDLVLTNVFRTPASLFGRLGDGLGLIRLASANGSVALVGY
jgi:hypothetical protein